MKKKWLVPMNDQLQEIYDDIALDVGKEVARSCSAKELFEGCVEEYRGQKYDKSKYRIIEAENIDDFIYDIW